MGFFSLTNLHPPDFQGYGPLTRFSFDQLNPAKHPVHLVKICLCV
eukprot:UN07021